MIDFYVEEVLQKADRRNTGQSKRECRVPFLWLV